MARKIDMKTILKLSEMGINRNAITSTKHISPHSISEILNIARERQITFSFVKDQKDEEIHKLFYPDKY